MKHYIRNKKNSYREIDYKIDVEVNSYNEEELRFVINVEDHPFEAQFLIENVVHKKDVDPGLLQRLVDRENYDNIIQGGLESFRLDDFISEIEQNFEEAVDKAYKIDQKSGVDKIQISVMPFSRSNRAEVLEFSDEKFSLPEKEYKEFTYSPKVKTTMHENDDSEVLYKIRCSVDSPDWVTYRTQSFSITGYRERDELEKRVDEIMESKIDDIIEEHNELIEKSED